MNYSSPVAEISKATRFLESGKGRKAERILRRLLRDAPDNAEVLHLLGVAWWQAGDTAKASEFVEQAITADWNDPRFYVTLGDIFSARGLRQDAVSAFRKAVALDPADAEARVALGSFLKELGELDEALDCFNAVLRLQPARGDVVFRRGETFHALNRVDDAIEDFRFAVQQNPKAFNAYVPLGVALRGRGDLAEAFKVFSQGALQKYAPDALDESVAKVPIKSSKGKLLHDAEQIEYLIDKGVLDGGYAEYADLYRKLIETGSKTQPLAKPFVLPIAARKRILPIHNRIFHLKDAPRLNGPAINPDLDSAAIDRAYYASDPNLIAVDNLLTPLALQGIRDFCLESTIWFRSYENGYLGAFMSDGFACGLIAQIAEELAGTFPEIFRDYKLNQAWAFKYDSRLTGINRHADFAAVNVNFWVTPDNAVSDRENGGLVVWDKAAPLDWDFEVYNADQDAIQTFLTESGAKPIRVSHRQNRALIFDSDLIHETDTIDFKEGYENRRINITLLYGSRETV